MLSRIVLLTVQTGWSFILLLFVFQYKKELMHFSLYRHAYLSFSSLSSFSIVRFARSLLFTVHTLRSFSFSSSLSFSYGSVVVQLSFIYHSFVIQLSFSYGAVIVQLSLSCSVIVQSSFSYRSDVVQLSLSCRSVIVQLFFSCRSVIVQLSFSCRSLSFSCR